MLGLAAHPEVVNDFIGRGIDDVDGVAAAVRHIDAVRDSPSPWGSGRRPGPPRRCRAGQVPGAFPARAQPGPSRTLRPSPWPHRLLNPAPPAPRRRRRKMPELCLPDFILDCHPTRNVGGFREGNWKLKLATVSQHRNEPFSSLLKNLARLKEEDSGHGSLKASIGDVRNGPSKGRNAETVAGPGRGHP